MIYNSKWVKKRQWAEKIAWVYPTLDDEKGYRRPSGTPWLKIALLPMSPLSSG
jgi:hypothetical protein